MKKSKQKVIEDLRILKMEALQNDYDIQSILTKQTNKTIIRKAKRRWKKTGKAINKKLDKLERLIVRL